MTTKEALHLLVDELPEDRAELAKHWLEDLRNAPDEGGTSLDADALASLERGLADLSDGRAKSLEEYERERGL